MKTTTSPLTDEGLEFDELTSDEARFEYAQYIVNTSAKMRPEISSDNEDAALSWLRDQDTE